MSKTKEHSGIPWGFVDGVGYIGFVLCLGIVIGHEYWPKPSEEPVAMESATTESTMAEYTWHPSSEDVNNEWCNIAIGTVEYKLLVHEMLFSKGFFYVVTIADIKPKKLSKPQAKAEAEAIVRKLIGDTIPKKENEE